MTEPRVPGGPDTEMTLPCGEEIDVRDLDMGLRDLECVCGERHGVVMDVHPPTRFLPEMLVEQLRSVVDTADDLGSFGTAHLLGMVLEEYPGQVVAEDVSDHGEIGVALVWVTEFDSRRLHELVVELVVEMMDHAVSHADDEEAQAQFEEQMHEFDVETFVDRYRAQRDFADEHDTPV